MTLINCPECNHHVSEKATNCPNCGLPFSLPEPHPLELIKGYSEQMERNWELISSINKATSSRFIWYVAICGYAAINLRWYAELIFDHPIQRETFFWIVLPWIVTSVCSVLGEFFLSIMISKDSMFYAAKFAHVNSTRAKKGANLTFEDVAYVIRGSDDKVSSSKRTVKRFAFLVKVFEPLTLAMLTISFIWFLVCQYFIPK